MKQKTTNEIRAMLTEEQFITLVRYARLAGKDSWKNKLVRDWLHGEAFCPNIDFSFLKEIYKEHGEYFVEVVPNGIGDYRLDCGLAERKDPNEVITALIPGDQKEFVQDFGFAKFNSYDHLLVDVPKEGLTVSCKIPDGRRVTFSFIPDSADSAMECVDVCLHDSPELPERNMRNKGCNKQEWILFNGGTNAFRTEGEKEKSCTLATLLLNERHYKVSNNDC